MARRGQDAAVVLELVGLLALVLIAVCACIVPSPAGATGCGSVSPSPAARSRADARDAVLCLVDRQRADAGLRPLESNHKLQRAAQRHTARMAASGCFDHRCGAEADLGARLERVGYLGDGLTRWAYGENIAWVAGARATPTSLVDAWMQSPPHRANILSPGFADVGVGFSAGTPGNRSGPGATATLDFGMRAG